MTRVQTKKSGRIVSTIPIDYAETLPHPVGQHLSWHVESRTAFSAKPEGQEEPEDIKTTQIQYNDTANQYSVSIPTGLAHAMHMLNADLNWDLKRGRFYISIHSRGDTDE